MDDVYKRSNLTRLQLLNWMGQKLRPEAPLFNAILTFTIMGEVDPAHFQKAFQALLDQSDALRTVIEEIEETPRQRVLSTFPYELEYLDFSQEPEPHGAYQSWLHRRCIRPLNLEVCLFDTALIKISADQFVWYLNQHHVIADASSAFLIFERVTELYERSLKGEPLTLSGLPTFQHYVDYERAYRNSPQHLKAETYWQKKLNPGPEPASFFGRIPVKKSTQVRGISFDLGSERSEKLRLMAREKEIFTANEELSLYNIFGALFFIELYRLSGNHHLGVITPVHNRSAKLFRDIIGMVMELCPLQLEVAEDDTFLSVIKKVRRETRETLAYYQYGSEISNHTEHKFFEVMFNTHTMPTLNLKGMPIRLERIYPGHGNESLALHVLDMTSSGKFLLHFDMHYDIFSEAQANQVVQSFVQLVDAFLGNADQSIGEVKLSLSEEQLWLPANGHGAHQSSLEPTRTFVAPRDALEQQLIEIWEKVFNIQPIGVTDTFFELGGDSLLAVRLLGEIEKGINQKLPLATLFQAPTVEQQAKVIGNGKGASTGSSLVSLQSGGSRRPFFTVPPLGGIALRFATLAYYLGPDQPFYGLHAQGLEENEVIHTRVEDMAAHYVKEIRTLQPEGPYLIGGACFGATVAYEMAQQIHAQDQKVGLLVIFDSAAPSSSNLYDKMIHYSASVTSQRSSMAMLRYLQKTMKRYIIKIMLQRVDWQRMPTAFMPVHDYFLRLKQKMKGGNLERPTEDTSQQRRLHKVIYTHSKARRSYVPKPYPGKVIYFKAADRQNSPVAKSMSWSTLVLGGVDYQEVPGVHGDMFIKEEYVQILAEKLSMYLHEAQEAASNLDDSQPQDRVQLPAIEL